ncbi:MAG TPA: DUF3597 domain-containing protein [Thermoanaerobaculia bacterium]|nr:DUF3597 domain-containing protein [Thermoanaerobaculia bacterium]
MGLFSVLMQKIFHAGAVAEAPPDAVKPGQNPESRVEAAIRQGVPVAQAVPNAPGPAGAAPAAPKMSEVDVEAVLNGLAAKHHEKLDWKHSIVDLMKLVGMESSLAERKELAADLHYTGDTHDSAAMNIWLHKEVMKKLAENGGKVPQSLLTH